MRAHRSAPRAAIATTLHRQTRRFIGETTQMGDTQATPAEGSENAVERLRADRPTGPGRDLGAAREGELGEDVGDVTVDGSLRDDEPSADLAVGLTTGDEVGDLALAPG